MYSLKCVQQHGKKFIMPERNQLTALTSYAARFLVLVLEPCSFLSVFVNFSRMCFTISKLSRDMRFPTMWYVRPAKPQISLRSLIRAIASRLNIL